MNLFHEVVGNGRPLVALHGGFGLDHTYFRPWLDALPAQLVLPDLRGCGRSPHDGLADADFGTLASDVDELRAQLGHGEWTVLGHSFGAYVALEYARRFPDRVGTLVLVDGAPALDYPDVISANLQRHGTPEQLALLQRAMSAPLESDDEFRRAWRLLLPLYFHRFEAWEDAGAIYSATALFHGFRMLSQFSALPWLGNLRMPALVMTGRHDWIAPPAQGAERLKRGLPNARIEIFEESGHFPFIEENAKFLAVLGQFLGDPVQPAPR
ncbi:MAG: alpha/beta fold hydrolase [Myxococcales bacterium]|nr:alpha/beta hydrolase [Myxococcales bacterium]